LTFALEIHKTTAVNGWQSPVAVLLAYDSFSKKIDLFWVQQRDSREKALQTPECRRFSKEFCLGKNGARKKGVF